jgi:YHS domain-containing protein
MRFSNVTVAISLTLAALVLALPIAVDAKNPSGNATIRQVDPRFVCMVDKKYFDEPQKPVVIEGRTYYVCSDLSVVKLMQDPSSRMAGDPLSGKKVDKATATVGVDKVGNVYFFENPKNLNQFRLQVESAGWEVPSTSRPAHPGR